MANFTQEQTELIVEKLLDIMTNGSSKMLSAKNNLPDPDGSGIGLRLALLVGVVGPGSGNSLSEDETKELRTELIKYISQRKGYVQFGADYSVEHPLSDILRTVLGRLPEVLPMKSSFIAEYDTGVSFRVVRSSAETWTFEQLKEEYKNMPNRLSANNR